MFFFSDLFFYNLSSGRDIFLGETNTLLDNVFSYEGGFERDQEISALAQSSSRAPEKKKSSQNFFVHSSEIPRHSSSSLQRTIYAVKKCILGWGIGGVGGREGPRF